jgi:hypothetical protein
MQMDVTFQRNTFVHQFFFSLHVIALKIETSCSYKMMFTNIPIWCHNPNNHIQNIVMFCSPYLDPCSLSNEPCCEEIDNRFFISCLYSFKTTNLMVV